jgi:hypothetical protein
VSAIAAAWPDIAKDYLLIGINGEQPSDIGDDPRFNYTYVDYVGRSTFKGYPGTDRESPRSWRRRWRIFVRRIRSHVISSADIHKAAF